MRQESTTSISRGSSQARLHQTLDNEYKIAKIAKNIAIEQGDIEEYKKQSEILSYLSFLHSAVSYPEEYGVLKIQEKEN